MSEPCSQAADIAVMREQVHNSRKETETIRIMLEQMSRTLSQIAEQGVEIRHLHEDSKRNEKAINEIFGRLRLVELSPGRAAGKFFWIVVTATTSIGGGLIATLVGYFFRGTP